MSSEPRSAQNPIFALITILVAIGAGLFARLALVLVARGIGGHALLEWFESTALGLAVLAALMQSALLAVVWLRAALVPELRDALVWGSRNRESRWLPSLLLILGLGPLANLCGLAIAKVTGANLQSIEQIATLIRRASPIELVPLALVLTLMPALVEESLFRGLVFGSLRGIGVGVAVVLQAIAFGFFHLDVAQGVATSILGLGFGYIVMTTGSLVGAMVAHAGYNLTVLLSQRFISSNSGADEFHLLSWTGAEVAFGLAVTALAARTLLPRETRSR
ncbi:MAG: CPBP family intramembrane metalloprotease [Polyangiaceae bacterium]